MSYRLRPLGRIRKRDGEIRIEIDAPYREALLGLDGFSDIHVLYWFHENDTAEKRATLRVHPRGDAANPLMGVFGTHSPLRPNPIGLSRCRILAVEGSFIRIDSIDARDGSPVIDIKAFIPEREPDRPIRVPAWV